MNKIHSWSHEALQNVKYHNKEKQTGVNENIKEITKKKRLTCFGLLWRKDKTSMVYKGYKQVNSPPNSFSSSFMIIW